MGLNSSMQQIVKYTQKITQVLDPNKWLSVRVPGGLSSLFGGEDDEDTSTLGDLLNELNTTAGDIMTGANLVRCAILMATEDGIKGYGDFLAQMAMGAMGAITAVADAIMDAIYIQISNAVNQIVNLFTSFIDAIFNVWAAMCQIWDALENWWDKKGEWVKFNFEWALAQENCADMYAAIGACLLNKFLGPYLDEFKEKAVNAINNYGNDLNNMIYEEISDARTFIAYANQEAFLLKKAALQINGLTRENLIGNSIGQ